MAISAADSSKMTASTESADSASKDPWVVVGAPPKDKNLKAPDMRVASESKIEKVSKAMNEVVKANVLHNSIRSGKLGVIEYNIKHCDKKILNTKNNEGMKAMYVALACPNIVTADRVAIVKMLLKKGADVHDISLKKEDAVHIAVKFGVNKEIVQCLIKAGADINAYSTENINAAIEYRNSNRNSLQEFFK